MLRKCLVNSTNFFQVSNISYLINLKLTLHCCWVSFLEIHFIWSSTVDDLLTDYVLCIFTYMTSFNLPTNWQWWQLVFFVPFQHSLFLHFAIWLQIFSVEPSRTPGPRDVGGVRGANSTQQWMGIWPRLKPNNIAHSPSHRNYFRDGHMTK